MPSFAYTPTREISLRGNYDANAFKVPYSSNVVVQDPTNPVMNGQKYVAENVSVQAPTAPAAAGLSGHVVPAMWTEGPYGLGAMDTAGITNFLDQYGVYIGGGLLLLLLLGGKRRR